MKKKFDFEVISTNPVDLLPNRSERFRSMCGCDCGQGCTDYRNGYSMGAIEYYLPKN